MGIQLGMWLGIQYWIYHWDIWHWVHVCRGQNHGDIVARKTTSLLRVAWEHPQQLLQVVYVYILYIYILYIEIYNPSYKLGENVWFVDLRLRLQLTKCFVGIYPTIELIIPIIQWSLSKCPHMSEFIDQFSTTLQKTVPIGKARPHRLRSSHPWKSMENHRYLSIRSSSKIHPILDFSWSNSPSNIQGPKASSSAAALRRYTPRVCLVAAVAPPAGQARRTPAPPATAARWRRGAAAPCFLQRKRQPPGWVYSNQKRVYNL